MVETDLASPQVYPEHHLTDREDVEDVAIIVSFFWSQEDRILRTEAPGAISFFPLCHFLSNNYRFGGTKRWRRGGGNLIFAQAI
jgi:hypothetical protein